MERDQSIAGIGDATFWLSKRSFPLVASRNDRLATGPNTSTRRNSVLLMGVLFTATCCQRTNG